MRTRTRPSDYHSMRSLRGWIFVAAANAGWSDADLSSFVDETFGCRFDQLNFRQLQELALHFGVPVQRPLTLDHP